MYDIVVQQEIFYFFVVGHVAPQDVIHLADNLAAVLEDGDVVLTLGAGSIGAVALELPDALRTLKVVG